MLMFVCQETPVEYHSRPQAFVKHQLLEAYLERLLHIVGASADRLKIPEVIYVDCFAGPWLDDGATIETTSIAIAIKQLVRAKMHLFGKTRAVFGGVFVEKDPIQYEQLKQYLEEQQKLTKLKLVAIHGTFPECIPNLLSACGTEAFCFFFVDPFGYKVALPRGFAALIARPRSEMLINFMFDHVNRFKEHPNENHKKLISQLLGPDVAGLSDKEITAAYCEKVITYAGSKKSRAFYASMPVLKPEKSRTYYELVYLTFHPTGLIEFKNLIEEHHQKQLLVQAETKARNSELRTGQSSLFLPTSDDIKQFPIGNTQAAIGALLLEKISDAGGRLVVDTQAFAKLLCEFDCLPNQLQQCIGQLLAAQQIQNLNYTGSKRKKHFVHYEKVETLAMVSSS
jgi:three-Cys-motif partner protein